MQEKLNEFEKAIVRALVQDEESPRPRRPPDVDGLEVESRSLSGCGFLTELRDTAEAHAYANDVSLRWGAKFGALINSEEHVDMVVYVDQGRITAVEACTFGGVDCPEEIREFKVQRIEDDGWIPGK